jgi:hypothetical protein
MVTWDGPLPEPQVRTAEDLRQFLAKRSCTIQGPPLFYVPQPRPFGWGSRMATGPKPPCGLGTPRSCS